MALYNSVIRRLAYAGLGLVASGLFSTASEHAEKPANPPITAVVRSVGVPWEKYERFAILQDSEGNYLRKLPEGGIKIKYKDEEITPYIKTPDELAGETRYLTVGVDVSPLLDTKDEVKWDALEADYRAFADALGRTHKQNTQYVFALYGRDIIVSGITGDPSYLDRMIDRFMQGLREDKPLIKRGGSSFYRTADILDRILRDVNGVKGTIMFSDNCMNDSSFEPQEILESPPQHATETELESIRDRFYDSLESDQEFARQFLDRTIFQHKRRVGFPYWNIDPDNVHRKRKENSEHQDTGCSAWITKTGGTRMYTHKPKDILEAVETTRVEMDNAFYLEYSMDNPDQDGSSPLPKYSVQDGIEMRTQTKHAMSRPLHEWLTYYLNHPDPLYRLAAAMESGEHTVGNKLGGMVEGEMRIRLAAETSAVIKEELRKSLVSAYINHIATGDPKEAAHYLDLFEKDRETLGVTEEDEELVRGILRGLPGNNFPRRDRLLKNR